MIYDMFLIEINSLHREILFHSTSKSTSSKQPSTTKLIPSLPFPVAVGGWSWGGNPPGKHQPLSMHGRSE